MLNLFQFIIHLHFFYKVRLIGHTGTMKRWRIAMTHAVITSAENKIFKALCRLLDARGLKKQERMIVAGVKLIGELAASRPQDCRSLIVPDRLEPCGLDPLVRHFAEEGKLIVLKRGLFRMLDIFHTGYPLLEFTAPAIPQWDGVLTGKGCTLLLPFQDPANVGAAVRSAAAFGVRQVVLLREAAHPYHPKSIRASAGAVFKLLFSRGPALGEVMHLPDLAERIVALDMGGASIHRFAFPAQFLLLPGIEGQGLPEGLRRQAVAIPMTGAVESLNAAAAVSIALFFWSVHQDTV